MATRNRRPLLLVVLLGAGIWAAGWYGPRMLREARATAGWPTVEGTVVESSVTTSSGARNRSTSYAVRITYRYAVDGDAYRSTRYGVAGDLKASSRPDAELRARAFRPGDPVTVHYDPADPGRAVLAVGGAGKSWMVIGFGAVLIVAAGVIMVRQRPGRHE